MHSMSLIWLKCCTFPKLLTSSTSELCRPIQIGNPINQIDRSKFLPCVQTQEVVEMLTSAVESLKRRKGTVSPLSTAQRKVEELLHDDWGKKTHIHVRPQACCVPLLAGVCQCAFCNGVTGRILRYAIWLFAFDAINVHGQQCGVICMS